MTPPEAPERARLAVTGAHLDLWRWRGRASAQPTICALHGMTGSGRDFEGLIDAGDGAFHWLAPDWWGHHASAALPQKAEPWALGRATVGRLLAEAPAGRSVYLLGYSMGARLAWDWWHTIEPPDIPAHLAGVILVGGRPGLSNDARQARREAEAALPSPRDAESLEAFLRAWEAQPVLAGQAHIPTPWGERLKQRRREHQALPLAKAWRAWSLATMPGGDHVATRDVPLALVHGETDTKFATLHRHWATQLPHAQVVTLPQAGHTAHLEQPAAMDNFLTKFCRIP